MFRKKSMDKLHEPESLDQLLVVVTPRSVWTLVSLIVVLLVGLIWGIYSRIPITVDGFGILVKPGSIKTVQAIGSGTVFSVRTEVGSKVTAGDPIVLLNNPEQDRQLDIDIARYEALSRFNDRTLAISATKRDLEIDLVNSNIAAIETDKAAIADLRERLGQQMRENVTEETESLQRNQKLLSDLHRSQKKQLQNITKLIRDGAASNSQRLQMQATLTDTESRMSDMNLRKNSAELRSIDTEQQDLRLKQELTQLETQLQQQIIKRQQIQQDFDFEKHRKSMELSELAAKIRLTKERHYRQQIVHSAYSGKTLEVATSIGETVSSGERVAILQIESVEPFKRLVFGEDIAQGQFSFTLNGVKGQSLSYPANAQSIKEALLSTGAIAQPDKLQVKTRPSKLEFDIYFSDDDDVFLEINDEDLVNDANIPTFATALNLGGRVQNKDLQHLCFFPIGKGKKVVPKMKIRISPSSVERQRYGSIIGEVTDVSAYPVTSEGVLNLTGNKDVAAALLEKGGTILVNAQLKYDEDDPQRYAWTAKGYDREITAGTTTTCRITIEERAPISFVVPLMRKWLMGDVNDAPPI